MKITRIEIDGGNGRTPTADAMPAAPRVIMPSVQCHRCGQSLPAAHIVSGHPARRPGDGRHTVARRIYFPCCRYMIRWWEYSDEHGRLTGELVDGTGYADIITDRAVIDTFLEHHPHLAELEAA